MGGNVSLKRQEDWRKLEIKHIIYCLFAFVCRLYWFALCGEQQPGRGLAVPGRGGAGGGAVAAAAAGAGHHPRHLRRHPHPPPAPRPRNLLLLLQETQATRQR